MDNKGQPSTFQNSEELRSGVSQALRAIYDNMPFVPVPVVPDRLPDRFLDILRDLASSDRESSAATSSLSEIVDISYDANEFDASSNSILLSFEAAVDRLTEVREMASRAVEEGVEAIAMIQLQGDRIERVNLDNRRILGTFFENTAAA